MGSPSSVQDIASSSSSRSFYLIWSIRSRTLPRLDRSLEGVVCRVCHIVLFPYMASGGWCERCCVSSSMEGVLVCRPWVQFIPWLWRVRISWEGVCGFLWCGGSSLLARPCHLSSFRSFFLHLFATVVLLGFSGPLVWPPLVPLVWHLQLECSHWSAVHWLGV